MVGTIGDYKSLAHHLRLIRTASTAS